MKSFMCLYLVISAAAMSIVAFSLWRYVFTGGPLDVVYGVIVMLNPAFGVVVSAMYFMGHLREKD